MATKRHVGVSGFSYPSWKGVFYPKDLSSEEFLVYYSKHLSTVEINSSFYAEPTAAMIESWAERTKPAFRFSFKAPKMITHTLKIGKGAPEAAERLSKKLGSLGPRRGALLFQLPPFMKQDLKVLDDFLTQTDGIVGRVFEFRHDSWLVDSTYQLLEKHGVGFCIAETEDLAPRFQVCGGIAYFRLRKDSYHGEAIDEWAGKILATAKAVETYVYLRHDETGTNAIMAGRLSEALERSE